MKRSRALFRRPLLALGVAGLILAAAVAAAVAAGVSPISGGTPPEPPLSVQTPVTAVGSVAAPLTSQLAVFRRDRTNTDTLPPSVDRMMDAVMPGAGANAGLARRALVTPGGTAVYLVPSRTGLCLLNSTGSQEFCASEGAVLRGEATSSTDCSPTLPSDVVEVAGILPDGASNPSLGLSNGSSVPLDVSGNAYVERFRRGDPLPRSISWDSATGRDSAATAVPPDAATLKCVTPQDVQDGRAPSVPR